MLKDLAIEGGGVGRAPIVSTECFSCENSINVITSLEDHDMIWCFLGNS